MTSARRRPSLPHATERLVLRGPSANDAEAVQRAIEETYEGLRLWMPWAAQMPSLEDTRAFLQEAEAKFNAGEDFAVSAFLKISGEYILSSGLHPRNWNVPKFEIGYWCRASQQGKGFATEAVKALTRLAFLEMQAERLEIRCDSRNERSRRVAELAGFRLEATLRSDDRANDHSLRDTLVFACLRNEWQEGVSHFEFRLKAVRHAGQGANEDQEVARTWVALESCSFGSWPGPSLPRSSSPGAISVGSADAGRHERADLVVERDRDA